MFSLKTLLASSLLASTALAHFNLDFPATRGFDEDKESQFCGGFNTSATRQPFPLGKAPVWIDGGHPQANVYAMVSTFADPTSLAEFNNTANGTSIPAVTDWFPVKSGESCWNIDLQSLNLGLTNGSLVTLQIMYSGGDGSLYQCSDLVLLSDYTVPDNRTCSNDSAIAVTSGAATATSSANATATSAKNAASVAMPVSFGAVAAVVLALAHVTL